MNWTTNTFRVVKKSFSDEVMFKVKSEWHERPSPANFRENKVKWEWGRPCAKVLICHSVMSNSP